MKYHYAAEVFDSPDAPELEEGHYVVMLEEDAEQLRRTLENIAKWVAMVESLDLTQRGALAQIKLDAEQALK